MSAITIQVPFGQKVAFGRMDVGNDILFPQNI